MSSSITQAVRDFRDRLREIRKAQDLIYESRLGYITKLKEAEEAVDAVVKQRLLAEAAALPFPKDLRVRFFKDWHDLANVNSLDEFLALTANKNWGPKRRGEAFERWVQINKMNATSLPKVAFRADDTVIEAMDIPLGKTKRIPDRFKVRSRAVWDWKHFKLGTVIDESQLADYIALINADEDLVRVCYLFSTQQAASDNLARFQNAVAKLKADKSIHVFYLDSPTATVRRLRKLP